MALIDNLEVYYKFDGDHTDSAGSLDLTQVGTVSTSVAAKFGNGATFPGNSANRLTHADDVLLDLNGDFTISFWIKWATLTAGIVFSKQLNSTSGWSVYCEYEHLLMTKTNGFAVAAFLCSAGDAGGIGQPPSIVINTWYHFVIRRSGNSWSMWKNGVSVHTGVTMTEDLNNSNTFIMGEYVGLNYPLNGIIDEWAKWSRAISDSEIGDLYNGGTGLEIESPPILPTSIASAESFGTPVLALALHPTSIASAESFGTPSLVPAISPTSIASAEEFGTPTLAIFVHPTGIASAESFGTPFIGEGVYPTSIASAEEFGTPTLDSSTPLVVVSAEAEQRDTRQTFHVDVGITLYHPSDDSIPLGVEYSTEGDAGPWSTATSQPYDRLHTCVEPGSVMTPVPAVAPGGSFNYVWAAFSDLAEGTYEVHLRLNVGGILVVFGPIDVTTVIVEEDSALARSLRRRAVFSLASYDFLGQGLVTPFQRGSRDFTQASGVELVKACIRSIFSVRAAYGRFPGDLPWRPDFGHKLWTLRHRNNDGHLRAEAIAYVQEAFGWEPRARVVSVEVTQEVQENTLRARIRYQVIDRDTSDNRVVLPEFEEIASIG